MDIKLIPLTEDDREQFILDNQDAWSYVVDPDTRTLLYVNSWLQQKHPGVVPGMVCYRVLENRDVPCDHCPLRQLDHRKNHSFLLNRKDQKAIILVEGTKIRWNGEDACLVSGRKIPAETIV
jgi:putative two-component system response regulator